MISAEQETIQFVEKISPKEFKSNVELWLQKVEDQMKQSLKKVMEDSLVDLNTVSLQRSDWVRKWPG
jgi:dynein heavy chain, axonemal